MSRQESKVSILAENPFAGSLFGSECSDSASGYFYYQSLGSGSSGNCSFLAYKGEALLIDAGIGIKTFLKRANTLLKSALKPMGILITHDHGDLIK